MTTTSTPALSTRRLAKRFGDRDALAGVDLDVTCAVRNVAAGDAVLAASVTRRLLGQVARRLPAAVDARAQALGDLTQREHEVLRMLAAGPTVKTHVSNVLQKLGLRDRVQVVIYAYETGVVGRSDGP